jgi:hypothetical protein
MSFVPSISAENFKALQDDPGFTLPRRFSFILSARINLQGRVGIAALESGSG